MRSPLNSVSLGTESVSIISGTIIGVRLGFFPEFKGADSVLLHGTSPQLLALVGRLREFVASSLEEWPIHADALVSRRFPAHLFASRSGVSSGTGFHWRCSPAELPSIQGLLHVLAASGSGHQYFDLAGTSAQLIVSAGEYPESWWQANA